MDKPKRRRRWLQFSLRTLLILVVLVSVFCSWLAVGIQEKRAELRAMEVLVELGGHITCVKDNSLPALVLGLFGNDASETVTRLWLLSNAKVNNTNLVHVGQLHNLRTIELASPHVSDAVLAHLKKPLVRIRWLTLGSLNSEDEGVLTDEGLKHLSGMVRLTRLTLRGRYPKVTDAGLVHLKNLSNLELLDFDSTRVSDDGLEYLKAFPNLEMVSVNGTLITDDGLKHLKGLSNLRKLSIADTGVTDDGLEHLKGLTNLEFLILGRTGVTDDGLQHLKRLAKLQYLHLDETDITDRGLEHLERSTTLRSVNLSNTDVTDDGLECLAGLTNLVELNLRDTKVTPEGVEKLQAALPNCKIDY